MRPAMDLQNCGPAMIRWCLLSPHWWDHPALQVPAIRCGVGELLRQADGALAQPGVCFRQPARLSDLAEIEAGNIRWAFRRGGDGDDSGLIRQHCRLAQLPGTLRDAGERAVVERDASEIGDAALVYRHVQRLAIS